MTTTKIPLSIESAIELAAKPLGGVTNASVALGWDRFRLAHMANPNKKDRISFFDAMRLDQMCMDAGGGTPLMRHFQAFLAPEDGPRVSFFAHTQATVRESGSLIGQLVSALQDGTITRPEKRALLAVVQEFEAVLGGLKTDLGGGE
ncbi:MAG: hypothetical protein AAFY56_16835 [Pseudomonadota bacterium]